MSDTCPTCGVKCERLDLHICPKNAAYGGRGMSTAKTMIWHGKEAEHINAVIKAERKKERKATLDEVLKIAVAYDQDMTHGEWVPAGLMAKFKEL